MVGKGNGEYKVNDCDASFKTKSDIIAACHVKCGQIQRYRISGSATKQLNEIPHSAKPFVSKIH
jgi:hypothetical protein